MDRLKCRPDCECLHECEYDCDAGDISLQRKVIAWIWGGLILVCLLSALFWFFMTSTAAAAPQAACGPYANAVKFLLERYGETPVAFGQVNETQVIQIFASANGATFTVMSVQTDGTACFLMEGKGWEGLPPEDKGVSF